MTTAYGAYTSHPCGYTYHSVFFGCDNNLPDVKTVWPLHALWAFQSSQATSLLWFLLYWTCCPQCLCRSCFCGIFGLVAFIVYMMDLLDVPSHVFVPLTGSTAHCWDFWHHVSSFLFYWPVLLMCSLPGSDYTLRPFGPYWSRPLCGFVSTRLCHLGFITHDTGSTVVWCSLLMVLLLASWLWWLPGPHIPLAHYDHACWPLTGSYCHGPTSSDAVPPWCPPYHDLASSLVYVILDPSSWMCCLPHCLVRRHFDHPCCPMDLLCVICVIAGRPVSLLSYSTGTIRYGGRHP